MRPLVRPMGGLLTPPFSVTCSAYPPAPAFALQDIAPTWDSVIKILENNVGLSQFAGPTKGWLDLDMLYGGWVDTLVLVACLSGQLGA
jgi:hypothetical protein